jgi:uncharacterized damage-inducible protein DinB
MLSELIQYNHIANLEVIYTFSTADKSVPEAERLFSHILNAQKIWISRINKSNIQIDTFQLQPVGKYTALQEQYSASLKTILDEADLSEEISYLTGKGDRFTNTVSDILFHVVNHSTYHRGQIASIFRKNDVQPPVTDFIFYKREGKL